MKSVKVSPEENSYCVQIVVTLLPCLMAFAAIMFIVAHQ
jgi:hypothetical protein